MGLCCGRAASAAGSGDRYSADPSVARGSSRNNDLLILFIVTPFIKIYDEKI
jgi:hypothetical protein